MIKPDHSDTEIFRKTGMRLTRSSKFIDANPEPDRSAFAWLLDWRANLAIVLVFGIIGASQLYLGNDALGWGFIGIVIILSSSFVVFRVLWPAIKWIVNLVV